MRDEDIDYSDIPPLTPEVFRKAVPWPGKKRQITLRLDPDVVDYFQSLGRGYQTMINAVLRTYVQSSKPVRKTRRSN